MGESASTYLERISLTNFRNFIQLELVLPMSTVLLVGDNAQGKTNFLEAIYYLATTRSPRAGSERELINWGVQEEELPFARLEGVIHRGEERHRVEMTIAPAGGGRGGSYRRRIQLDGRALRALDFLGTFNVVLFLPEELSLVGGSPRLRRRYLDATICGLDAAYCRALLRYRRILAHRNRLLRRLRDGRTDPGQLPFWDQKLSQEGVQITLGRERAIRKLNQFLGLVHPRLAGSGVEMSLSYECSVTAGDREGHQMALGGEGEWETGRLEELYHKRLEEERPRELELGATRVGPHRDDFRFSELGIDLGIYGSRGQQRRAVVSMKLAEVELVRQRAGYEPILLLDDVMSELDPEHRGFLAAALQAPGQAIITTTDTGVFPPAFLEQATLLRIENAQIGRLSL
jgi:DNA replication and repair protein RecF